MTPFDFEEKSALDKAKAFVHAHLRALAGAAAALVLVIVAVFMLTRRDPTRKIDYVMNPKWHSIGRIGDDFFYVEGGTLSGRSLNGGTLYDVTLGTDEVQVLYGTKRIYVLVPGRRLSILEAKTGKLLHELESAELQHISLSGGCLCVAYRSHAVIYNSDFKAVKDVITGAEPVAVTVESPRRYALISAGRATGLKEDGTVSVDAEAAFTAAPEADAGDSETAQPPADSERKSEQTAEQTRYRFTAYSDGQAEFNVASTAERFLSASIIDVSGWAMRTDRAIYFIRAGRLVKRVAESEALDMAPINGGLGVLKAKTAQFYTATGEPSEKLSWEFPAQRLLIRGKEIFIIGEKSYAHFTNGKLNAIQTEPITGILDNADGSIDLLYAGGVQRIYQP